MCQELGVELTWFEVHTVTNLTTAGEGGSHFTTKRIVGQIAHRGESQHIAEFVKKGFRKK